MKTFLCEESVLRHNNRNCFPSYLDHYLTVNQHARRHRLGGEAKYFFHVGDYLTNLFVKLLREVFQALFEGEGRVGLHEEFKKEKNT